MHNKIFVTPLALSTAGTLFMQSMRCGFAGAKENYLDAIRPVGGIFLRTVITDIR